MRIRRLLASAAALAVGLGLFAPAAASTPSVLPDASRTGVVTVTRLTDDQYLARDGVTVTLYRLRYDATGAPINLTTRDGWNRASDMTHGQALEVPREYFASESTDGSVAYFENVPVGLFLVVLYYYNGDRAAAPFVITMPTTSTGGTEWLYEVHAIPKTGAPIWAHLGGVIWYDANRNGLFDEDEIPVEGAIIRVYTMMPGPEAHANPAAFNALTGAAALSGGVPVLYATTTSGPDGRWEFMYLPVVVKQVVYDISPLNPEFEEFTFTIYRAPSPLGLIYNEAYPTTGVAEPVQLIAWNWRFVDAGVVREIPVPTPPRLPVTGGTLAGIFIGLAAVGTGLFFKFGPARRRRGNDGA